MKLVIASKIDSGAIETLRAQNDVVCAFDTGPNVLKELISDREVLIFRSGVQITSEVMECAPHLKLLIRAGSGVDNLDVDYVNRRGLKLVRIPEPGAKAVAEMSFTFMLALSRNLVEADRLMKQGVWAKNKLAGHLLLGKILGIIGVGSIGTRLGELGVAWGMDVIGCDPAPLLTATQLLEKGIRLTSFDEVITTADYISLHVPLNDSTRYIIDTSALSRMKPGSFLVNLARGGVVDEQALYTALAEGRLAGAALDVHEQEGDGKISPLASFSNVILTPHIGAMAVEVQHDIGVRIIETVNTFTLSQHEPH